MDEQFTQMLKYLRLSGLLSNWDRYLSIAQKGNYSHTRLLEYVVEQEYNLKKENARKMRITRARIPEKYVIETFPFDRQPQKLVITDLGDPSVSLPMNPKSKDFEASFRGTEIR
ncbi:ATP-binding protein [uncultured Desulfobacter sp.]|uniref:ATP-binding protein n=1 Tax=uncultured Desulfobacter sp. TaxID=240139 RepID=UPI002AA81078|nr:ATP-binding protein [uncultured Desulfobacter sp.]